jgi:signal transduction histidine kinase/CheY-like chemotaxis protein
MERNNYVHKILTSPLSVRLIVRIILISLFITVISAIVQISFDYRNSLASIDRTMTLIEESDLESISASVYNIDHYILNIQLKGLTKLDSIVFVQVREMRGDEVYLISVGDESVDQDIVREFPLVHRSSQGEEKAFGTLLVAANLDGVYSRLLRRGLGILLENIVLVFFISVIIFFLTEFTITRHLARIADYTNRVDLNSLNQSFVLDRHKRKNASNDEFDVLIHSFNNMQKRIYDEIQKRKKNQEEKEKLEEYYIQTQKMESIGRLAGGVSHDLNNLLTPILICSDYLVSKSEEGDPDRMYIDGILEAGQKARDLVAQLLTFSRKSPMGFKVLNLNSVIEGVKDLLKRTIRENIQIDFHLYPELPNIFAERSQLEQIIFNLSVNGQDAMKGGGTLIVETNKVVLDDLFRDKHPEQKPGDYVMLAISDTGCGISEEVQSQIFEPFFSTKGDHGTGLGLATVYGIVKQHGGSIWVYSEIDNGTVFKIYFPINHGEKKQQTVKEESLAHTHRGKETILLVEDNEQVRNLTYKILADQDYNVYTAADGDEALNILSDPNIVVELLLTDVILPGLNGKELYREALKNKEDLKVLFMSGYTDNIISFEEEGGDNFIQKPFTRVGLIKRIRILLD